MNLYWAVQHHDGLTELREQMGLPRNASTPPFLVKSHTDVMAARSRRGGQAENKVRAAARKIMQRKGRDTTAR
jgi:hypothetical protein